MTPLALAWSNLRHKRTRTAIAASGVMFAVVLIFMELGLYGGVGYTASVLYENLRFDLLLLSSEYLDVSRPSEFPRARLAQARAVEGVADALPVTLGVGNWRLPAREGWFGSFTPPGGVKAINVLGVPPQRMTDIFAVDRGRVFDSPADARAAGTRLAELDTFLFDVRSKPQFGRLEDMMALSPSGEPVPGHPEYRNAIRLNGKRARIVGGFRLGTGFSWTGMLMCSEETFAEFTMKPRDLVTYGLITLKPGADAAQVQQKLKASLPSDVQVVTREEIGNQERRYWMRLTSIGQFLLVAVVLAVVVGVIFVYQMMAADIRNMLPEYATVKALGYRPPYLTAVVLWQALLLAVIGFIPGFFASLLLYYVARTVGGIPAEMTAMRAATVLALTGAMCLASGILAVRKVHTADPADLF
jgi:putative ABC transport system permease protein